MNKFVLLFLIILCSCKTVPKVKPRPVTKDHFFIFGGGYSATGNQISLEKNIFYMNSLLKEHPPSSKYVLFADGDNGERSLQYRVENSFPDKFQEMVIYCLGTTKRINDFYRPHMVVNQGPLKKVEIEKYFREKGTEIKKGERLFVYYTGHGAKGDKKEPQNTGMYLWHDGIYRMNDFASRLQTVPAEVPVICVMVQCYSGGFQNIVFKDGDPKKGLAENNICGFYATVYDRIAAGCTPEINEEDYQEYSTWFWAALSGKNRLGFKILKPDYNGDGKTSFEEAHAYTLINLRSIDIPTTSSELVLREYTPKTFSKSLGISQKSNVRQFIQFAAPPQKAVIEALAKQTSIPMEWTIGELIQKSEAIAGKMGDLKKVSKDKENNLKKLRPKVAATVKYHYPELGNPHHPAVNEILVGEKESLMKILKADKNFNDFESLYVSFEKDRQQLTLLEKEWVKCKRLIRVMENVLYEPYFLKATPDKIREKYLKMKELERGSL